MALGERVATALERIADELSELQASVNPTDNAVSEEVRLLREVIEIAQQSQVWSKPNE